MKPHYKALTTFDDWSSFFSYTNTLSKQDKGELFEKLTELIFKTKPTYKSRYKNVWLLRDGVDSKLKRKLNLPNSDEGIDLIAETHTGTYCAIQCKFKGSNESPTRKDIATFLDLSRNHCKNIAEQILVHTGTNGIKKTSLLPDSFTQIGLDFWSTLSEEDWRSIHSSLKNKKASVSKRSPRKHQAEAIKASVNYFLKDGNNRGKLIMPCGTGKSLTAYWIAQALKSKSTIVAVPSLALIKQSLEDWTKEMLLTNNSSLPDWICICSDESTGKLTDDFVTDTYSLGIPTTTNEGEIKTFLKANSPGGKIIFITYQSAEKLAKVSKSIKYKFELAILDEAHKTVGNVQKSFSTLLKDGAIRIEKRLFMTATERVVKGATDDILSMDDTAVYGSVFYQLSFKKAIEQNIITDYRIVTVLINDSEVTELIQKNKYLSDNKKKIDHAESQMLTSALALKKAISEYGINHTVSFHKSISAAKEFQYLYQKIDTGKKRPDVYHISSKMNAGDRSKLLMEFKDTEKAIITNARCLTEGVDVPAIDCVLFADEKHSIVDIVQASGRALRKFTNKTTGKKKELGYIIIPIVLKDGESFNDLTTSDRFKTVTRIVSSLSTHDETIAEELKILKSNTSIGKSAKVQFLGTSRYSNEIDLKYFSNKISIKIWEKVAKLNWRPYKESINYTKSLGLKNVKEWRSFCTSGSKPYDIPSKPYKTYPYEWTGWNNWLGVLNKNNWDIAKKRFSYNEAKTFLKKDCKGIISSMPLFNKWKNGQLLHDNLPVFPNRMPKNPKNAYNSTKDWKDSYDFFGTTRPKNLKQGKRLDFIYPKLPYKEFKSIVWKANLLSKTQFESWLNKIGQTNVKKGFFVPTKPDIAYRNEFEGWPIFLNTNYARSTSKSKTTVFLPFETALLFTRKLKLKTWTDWNKYINGEFKNLPPLPVNIPRDPSTVYKNKGWISWSHWLGK